MNNADDTPDRSSGDGTNESDDELSIAEADALGSSLEARAGDSPLLYTDLEAPQPAESDPPPLARWLAFGSILIAGLLGGLIGYGTADLMSDSSLIAALGGIVGAAACAIGVGIVAGLTLRAMNEWNVVKHPESQTRAASGLIMKSETQQNDEDDAPTDDGSGDPTVDDSSTDDD